MSFIGKAGRAFGKPKPGEIADLGILALLALTLFLRPAEGVTPPPPDGDGITPTAPEICGPDQVIWP